MYGEYDLLILSSQKYAVMFRRETELQERRWRGPWHPFVLVVEEAHPFFGWIQKRASDLFRISPKASQPHIYCPYH